LTLIFLEESRVSKHQQWQRMQVSTQMERMPTNMTKYFKQKCCAHHHQTHEGEDIYSN